MRTRPKIELTENQARLFWAKVNKDGPVQPQMDSPCWIWTASHSPQGYGQYTITGVTSGGNAHRIAYELVKGEIPTGLALDHVCRFRGCVNPDHLEPVTWEINTRRGRALVTHCPQGHPYSGDNLILYYGDPRGTGPSKKCRACANERRRKNPPKQKKKWIMSAESREKLNKRQREYRARKKMEKVLNAL